MINREPFSIVSVAFPIAITGLYDYRIPERFLSLVSPGMPVYVDLHGRKLWGIAIEKKSSSTIQNLKEIIDIKVGHWSDSAGTLIELYNWMSNYYHCDIGKVFKPLIRKRLIETSEKKLTFYSLNHSPINQKLSKKQLEAIQKISNLQGEITVTELFEKYGITKAMLNSLCSIKVLVKSKKSVVRQPLELCNEAADEYIPELTIEQKTVFESLKEELNKPVRPFLLHGITGSGKTYIYINLAKVALSQEKSVIILVPEISLTPQTIRRFRSAIGDEVAVIHSRMSDGERKDSLEQIVKGKKRVIIGVRSAILAPIDNLGLIVVDEEHDQSYKQSDMEPRYNARDVAVMRGRLQNALVILGSATPSLESYYNAISGKYGLLTINKRFGSAKLPKVKIIDMNVEHEHNNWSCLSAYLKNRIADTIERNRQVILLLNRRGFSTFLICKDCGHTYRCRYCSVNLTYHKSERKLLCHQCGFFEEAPYSCDNCGGMHLKYKGIGIQKAEEFISQQFPAARILRMDQDSTRRKGMHLKILDEFATHKADILIGTQMVSKGLDFPFVTLVGVLQADTGLHIPDFRASERTFQLLTQVAGRAGRCDEEGEVVIQTFFPDEHGIVAAQNHDFEGFYKKEIENRKQLGYPPFSRLARILIIGEAENMVENYANLIGELLKKFPSKHISFLGPSPAVLEKVDKKHRYSILIKSSSHRAMQEAISLIRGNTVKIAKKIQIIIDRDPINML